MHFEKSASKINGTRCVLVIYPEFRDECLDRHHEADTMAVVLLPVVGFLILTWKGQAFSPILSNSRGTRTKYASSSLPENGDDVDHMRRLLEASWNVETMGLVPTSAASAADAAAMSLQAALKEIDKLVPKGSGRSGFFFVDINLPQYDIRQGGKFYDEVMMVEFCALLAYRIRGYQQSESIKQHTVILVRDDKTVQTVNRVFNARQRADRISDDDDDNDDDDDEDQVDDETTSEGTLYYDDFGDLYKDEQNLSTDVDAFRENLQSSWNNDIVSISSSEAAKDNSKTDQSDDSPMKYYRLMSLFGDTPVSQGADMMNDVIRAVSQNVRIEESTETIVIVSAKSREEMIAVRALASKYEGRKTIILVNCHLDPIPRELIRAKTVYSLTPLIARPAPGVDPSAAPSAKIVLLRRYPQDWEVYIDVNGSKKVGFQLVATVPANQVNARNGPSLSWIAECAKQYVSKLTKEE